jgi:hypothetical protein
MIPEAIEKFDYNSHDYWPSSPMGGYREPMTLSKPQSGDMHYYVAYVNKPFSNILETQSHFFQRTWISIVARQKNSISVYGS